VGQYTRDDSGDGFISGRRGNTTEAIDELKLSNIDLNYSMLRREGEAHNEI
jgi:hypothetical protein